MVNGPGARFRYPACALLAGLRLAANPPSNVALAGAAFAAADHRDWPPDHLQEKRPGPGR